MIQTTNIIKEWVDDAHKQWKDKEGKRIAAVETLTVAEKRIKNLNTKLTEADRERKITESALVGVKIQIEDQRLQLRGAEDQLAIAKGR